MNVDLSGPVLERFANVVHAALAEVGYGHITQPAFLDDDGVPFLEYDPSDFDPEEVGHLVVAEQIALMSIGR